MIPAFYRVLRNPGPEASEELDKHLVAFEQELKDKTFIGGERPSLVFKMNDANPIRGRDVTPFKVSLVYYQLKLIALKVA